MDIKLKNLKQEYMGRCNIIPCCDLPKIEGSFELRKHLALVALAAQKPFTVEELKELEEFIIGDNGEKRGNSMVPSL